MESNPAIRILQLVVFILLSCNASCNSRCNEPTHSCHTNETDTGQPPSAPNKKPNTIEGEYYCRLRTPQSRTPQSRTPQSRTPQSRTPQSKEMNAVSRCSIQRTGPNIYALRGSPPLRLNVTLRAIDSRHISASGTGFLHEQQGSQATDRRVIIDESILTAAASGARHWSGIVRAILQFEHESQKGDRVDFRTGIRTPRGTEADLELSIRR